MHCIALSSCTQSAAILRFLFSEVKVDLEKVVCRAQQQQAYHLLYQNPGLP